MIIIIGSVKYNTKDRHYWWWEDQNQRWERIGLNRIAYKHLFQDLAPFLDKAGACKMCLKDYRRSLRVYRECVYSRKKELAKLYEERAIYNGHLLKITPGQVRIDLLNSFWLHGLYAW